MNAPRPMPPPTPPQAGPAASMEPAPDARRVPPGGGYPAGADVVGEQAAMGEQVDNPVIAGFRAIVMFIAQLESRQDPRAQMAKEHLAGLLQSLQGAPQSPPNAPPAQGPPAPAGMEGGAPNIDNNVVGGGPVEAAPPAGGPPALPPEPAPGAAPPIPPPAPAPGTGISPLGPNAGASGKVRPMHKQEKSQGKQPVVLT